MVDWKTVVIKKLYMNKENSYNSSYFSTQYVNGEESMLLQQLDKTFGST